MGSPLFARLLATCCLAVLHGAACAADLKVLTTGAFKQVVVALAPDFEARTGHKLEIVNDTAGAVARRIEGGETFDVVVLTPAALAPLAGSGRVDPATVTPLARVAIGVAVKLGSPAPAIATVEQFRAAVLQARRVAYIDPAAGGSSGIYLSGLFQRLGLADAVRPKAVLVPGGLVAERLATGEADLAIHQVSEILPVTGATLVGLLPAEIQNYTSYSGAVAGRTAQAEAARAFLATLAGGGATIRAKGMEPAR